MHLSSETLIRRRSLSIGASICGSLCHRRSFSAFEKSRIMTSIRPINRLSKSMMSSLEIHSSSLSLWRAYLRRACSILTFLCIREEAAEDKEPSVKAFKQVHGFLPEGETAVWKPPPPLLLIVGAVGLSGLRPILNPLDNFTQIPRPSGSTAFRELEARWKRAIALQSVNVGS